MNIGHTNRSFSLREGRRGTVLMLLLFFITPFAAMAQRVIEAIEPVDVKCPVGTAPRLPYRLYVRYDNGQCEYRQVRWNNSSLRVEQQQADAKATPVGTRYEVQGYIIGDNTTTAGFPVVANVSVVADAPAVPSPQPVAEPLPLNKVMLIGNNRLTHNRDMDIDNLLSLDVKQQLYNYRDTYGLPTDGYPKADGWDSPTTKLKGHGSGHYMSALAFAYASCPDQSKRAQLKERIQLMVDQLRQCQERTFVFDKELGRYREARDFAPEAELRQMKGSWADFDRYKQDYEHYGYGYINAIPAQHCVLIEMYRAYNNEQWVWAPYYSVHKQLAGLIDIANYVDDEAIAKKALLIAKDMGLWVWNRMHYRTFVKADGDQAERRARPGNRYEMWNMYIAGEVGGMAESLARLSTMVKDKDEKARLLEAANCFDSPAFFDPLARNIDAIRTRHANQHIPMVTGALWSYRGNHNPYYYNLAENFWTMIQGRYRYAMGGVGNGEMFRQPYTQMLSMNTNVGSDWRDRSQYPEPTINETCCAYNLAKLTKDLNCFSPDKACYMDYYERVLYNQIVGSLHPDHYAVLYQYAVGLNASKPWGNETPQSTCCGGTGAENHVKYQEAAYFVSDNTLWVGLYLPTEARWDAKGIDIRQECEWPAQTTRISIAGGKARFALKLRVPYWATDGFAIRLNGETVAKGCAPSTYVTISERLWKEGDVVEVDMPFGLHLDYGPDKMEIAATGRNETRTPFEPRWLGAVMNGPLVMAAKGIQNWQEATLQMAGGKWQLDKLQLLPDYEADRHVTHYFRLELPGTPLPVQTEADEGVDLTKLREAMAEAKSRRDAQGRWNDMQVKVPEYAPWAKHGFGRMMRELANAQRIMDNPDTSADQEAVNRAASALNAAINTMRPGNLPELEDLNELLPLLEQARSKTAGGSKALQEAVDYAEMVVKYVSDGSGTQDMIEKAAKRLREVMK
ncbi:MAG: glycoside hydrolase family 127 protein [Bacteroidaceae bacterium]|nr:glycoside hydrolase family 127 protein [Bacteroidaceae bacterium]